MSLPSGTVTFLFTDIEGSTRLLHRLGDRYGDLLADHRALFRSAIAEHLGREIDTQGDAFFVAFPSAKDAVAAAAEAQRAFARHVWPDGTELRVRMGVHTGEPLTARDGYVGLDVHHGARVAAVAHGGQVLVSQATRELLGDAFALRDLGEHRLKDLTQPQRLYQLLVEGLRADFPAINTLENRPVNLPVQPTPLVGRERELAEVIGLVGRTRLLTLTGPGGTGKTRLALQAAAESIDEFPNGVYFVTLAAVGDSALVVPTVARTLGLRESPGETAADVLTAYLRDKRLLLLLDNFEHVLGAAPEAAELASAAPGVRLLVTSRAPLRVAGEQEYEVSPLSLPTGGARRDPALLSQYDAVQLFVERARLVRHSFQLTSENAPAVAEICVRLDGLPLAIELAVARMRVLSPEAMLGRLEQRLSLLTGGARDAPARQQTLRATIEWSHDLLDESEQLLFARLGVFSGGWSLEAAEAVCEADLDVLESLVDKSLLRRRETPDGDLRFFMLATIREFAVERLEATGAAGDVRRRHAEHFLAVAEGLYADVSGSQFALLEREHDNVRAALAWAHQSGETDVALRLATVMAGFWMVRGYLSEGADRLEEALAASTDQTPTRVRALSGAAFIAYLRGRYERAGTLSSEQLELARALGDGGGVASALSGVANAARARGDHGEARLLYEEAIAIAREVGDRERLAASLVNLGDLTLFEQKWDEALPVLDEAYRLYSEAGDPAGMSTARFNAAQALVQLGREREALDHLAEWASLAKEVRSRGERAFGVELLAAIFARRGELERAAGLLGVADAAYEDVGLVLAPTEGALREQTLELVRSRLSDEALEAALRDGRTRPFDAALEEALAAAQAAG